MAERCCVVACVVTQVRKYVLRFLRAGVQSLNNRNHWVRSLWLRIYVILLVVGLMEFACFEQEFRSVCVYLRIYVNEAEPFLGAISVASCASLK